MEVKTVLQSELGKEIRAAATAAAMQASVTGRNGFKRFSDRLAEAGDAALVEMGERARDRMRHRAKKQTSKKFMKTIGRMAIVAGIAAAGVAAARAIKNR